MLPGFEGQGKRHREAWLTPLWILRALGPFDLDPCAAPEPRPWPAASRHFNEGGLDRTWKGRIWLNPPYDRRLKLWLGRLAEHGTGTALIFARTETAYFQDVVFKKAEALLFIRDRLNFCNAKGKEIGRSPAPSVLAAFGQVDRKILISASARGLIQGKLLIL